MHVRCVLRHCSDEVTAKADTTVLSQQQSRQEQKWRGAQCGVLEENRITEDDDDDDDDVWTQKSQNNHRLDMQKKPKKDIEQEEEKEPMF